MPKHCRDCRFAVCKPFKGRMVFNDRVRNKGGGLGIYLDSTRLTENPATFGPVRCAKGCWIYKNDARTPKKEPHEKTVSTVYNIMLSVNTLGKMAEICEYFDDMREE